MEADVVLLLIIFLEAVLITVLLFNYILLHRKIINFILIDRFQKTESAEERLKMKAGLAFAKEFKDLDKINPFLEKKQESAPETPKTPPVKIIHKLG